MKRNAIARIVIYSLLILLLTGILAAALGIHMYGFPTLSATGTAVQGEQISLEADEVSWLELEWVAGSITLLTADTDRITFQEQGENLGKYPLVYKLEGGVLSIEYTKSSVSLGFGRIPSKDLIITVPQDWLCKGLEVDGAALDVTVNGLNVIDFDIDGASNEIDFRGTLQEFECDGASCDLTLTCLEKPKAINLDGASIELELYLPEDCGFLVQMDGLSCSFHSDLDYTRGNGDYRYGDSHCKVNVDGLSCDITISTAPVVTEVE